MIPPFDILRITHSNQPVEVEGAQSLDAAISRVSVLRENDPGDYLIISRVTGKKILFSANGGVRRS